MNERIILSTSSFNNPRCSNNFSKFSFSAYRDCSSRSHGIRGPGHNRSRKLPLAVSPDVGNSPPLFTYLRSAFSPISLFPVRRSEIHRRLYRRQKEREGRKEPTRWSERERTGRQREDMAQLVRAIHVARWKAERARSRTERSRELLWLLLLTFL